MSIAHKRATAAGRRDAVTLSKQVIKLAPRLAVVSLCLVMEEFATPQIIIKALKGSSDPPNKGGPSKIEVAKYAWDSTSIRFLNKDEVLAEWIFTSFVKEKGNIR